MQTNKGTQMTESMTRQEELQSIYWDMYKDAHGFRPRHVDTTHWTEADFNAEFEMLERIIIRENQEHRAYAQAVLYFEERVARLMVDGAKTREVAIQWIHDAEDTGGDADSLCYNLGLPYGYLPYGYLTKKVK
jgi:hypothetical protein